MTKSIITVCTTPGADPGGGGRRGHKKKSLKTGLCYVYNILGFQLFS